MKAVVLVAGAISALAFASVAEAKGGGSGGPPPVIGNMLNSMLGKDNPLSALTNGKDDSDDKDDKGDKGDKGGSNKSLGKTPSNSSGKSGGSDKKKK